MHSVPLQQKRTWSGNRRVLATLPESVGIEHQGTSSEQCAKEAPNGSKPSMTADAKTTVTQLKPLLAQFCGAQFEDANKSDHDATVIDRIELYKSLRSLLEQDDTPDILQFWSDNLQQVVQSILTDLTIGDVPAAAVSAPQSSVDMEEVRHWALRTLGYFLHHHLLVQKISVSLVKDVCNALTKLIMKAEKKTTTNLCVWCFSVQHLHGIGPLIPGIIEAVVYVLNNNFDSHTVECEGLRALQRLTEQAPKEMLSEDMLLLWLPATYMRLIHEVPRVREAADGVLERLYRSHGQKPMPATLSERVLADVKETLLDAMNELLKSQQPKVAVRAWSHVVVLLGKNVVSDKVVNPLLKIPERTFTNRDPAVRVATFAAWKRIIENFSMHPTAPLYLSSPKRLRLVLAPMMNAFKREKLVLVRSAAIETLERLWQLLDTELGKCFDQAVATPVKTLLFPQESKSAAPNSNGKADAEASTASLQGNGAIVAISAEDSEVRTRTLESLRRLLSLDAATPPESSGLPAWKKSMLSTSFLSQHMHSLLDIIRRLRELRVAARNEDDARADLWKDLCALVAHVSVQETKPSVDTVRVVYTLLGALCGWLEASREDSSASQQDRCRDAPYIMAFIKTLGPSLLVATAFRLPVDEYRSQFRHELPGDHLERPTASTAHASRSDTASPTSSDEDGGAYDAMLTPLKSGTSVVSTPGGQHRAVGPYALVIVVNALVENGLLLPPCPALVKRTTDPVSPIQSGSSGSNCSSSQNSLVLNSPTSLVTMSPSTLWLPVFRTIVEIALQSHDAHGVLLSILHVIDAYVARVVSRASQAGTDSGNMEEALSYVVVRARSEVLRLWSAMVDDLRQVLEDILRDAAPNHSLALDSKHSALYHTLLFPIHVLNKRVAHKGAAAAVRCEEVNVDVTLLTKSVTEVWSKFYGVVSRFVISKSAQRSSCLNRTLVLLHRGLQGCPSELLSSASDLLFTASSMLQILTTNLELTVRSPPRSSGLPGSASKNGGRGGLGRAYMASIAVASGGSGKWSRHQSNRELDLSSGATAAMLSSMDVLLRAMLTSLRAGLCSAGGEVALLEAVQALLSKIESEAVLASVCQELLPAFSEWLTSLPTTTDLEESKKESSSGVDDLRSICSYRLSSRSTNDVVVIQSRCCSVCMLWISTIQRVWEGPYHDGGKLLPILSPFIVACVTVKFRRKQIKNRILEFWNATFGAVSSPHTVTYDPALAACLKAVLTSGASISLPNWNAGSNVANSGAVRIDIGRMTPSPIEDSMDIPDTPETPSHGELKLDMASTPISAKKSADFKSMSPARGSVLARKAKAAAQSDDDNPSSTESPLKRESTPSKASPSFPRKRKLDFEDNSQDYVQITNSPAKSKLHSLARGAKMNRMSEHQRDVVREQRTSLVTTYTELDPSSLDHLDTLLSPTTDSQTETDIAPGFAAPAGKSSTPRRSVESPPPPHGILKHRNSSMNGDGLILSPGGTVKRVQFQLEEDTAADTAPAADAAQIELLDLDAMEDDEVEPSSSVVVDNPAPADADVNDESVDVDAGDDASADTSAAVSSETPSGGVAEDWQTLSGLLERLSQRPVEDWDGVPRTELAQGQTRLLALLSQVTAVMNRPQQ